ncbi:uncharacterized protein LOC133291556 [Gastrolobium bilobum]|uniref:uncharacterized protein LOC133291556 n=1 Tax=Gastrolobium bilobum TaxID=150636 RepID=UPI002AB0E658|nr:uncharacterized protein LOC133291556 [Gastrolobium bilobum]
MEAEASFSQVAPPVFDGENYDIWAVRMESYLEALDLWEAEEEDYEVPPLPIMTLKSAKEIWDYLKEEYAGDERIRSMHVLNLMREFKLQKMKESETIKEYSDRLLGIANKVRLLGTAFVDSRIVEKILVIVLKIYEASITTLENTKDLSKITLAGVLHALQA